MADLVERVGGRIGWAGSIDQQFIGHGLESFQDVVISEFPTAEACGLAMALRREWRPETFVSELASWALRPWPGWQRLASRAVFAALRLGGGAPVPVLGDPSGPLIEPAGDPSLAPDPQQTAALLASDRSGRVVMVNYLRYRASQEGTADELPRGPAAYAAYGRVATRLIARLGGRIRFSGSRAQVLSSDPEARWDAVAVVEYPSRAAFIGMLEDPRYRAAHPLRDAGLDSTRLLVCTSHASFH
jgi:uncharacterized protein (DUF1330 family)